MSIQHNACFCIFSYLRFNNAISNEKKRQPLYAKIRIYFIGTKRFFVFHLLFHFSQFSLKCGKPALLSVFDATYSLSSNFANVSASPSSSTDTRYS